MAKNEACINIIDSDNDPLYISKFNLEQVRKDNKVPASESVEFLKSYGVADGEINNIQSKQTIEMAEQFFKEYTSKADDPNYDSPSLWNIADEKIPGFKFKKLVAPVYYVLQKGGKSSKKLADNLLDFDVVYTRDKAFADETIDQVVKVLGKDSIHMNLLEVDMRKQKGRKLSASEIKAVEAFDLKNPKTNKLWSMKDEGFDSLDEFTRKHIVAREYHKQMTDFYWKRIKQEMKLKSTKFQYEEFLADFDEKYIKNYMTRAVSREVLMDIQKNGSASPVIVKIANERLKGRAAEIASEKFNKEKNPNKWEAEYDKNLKDIDLLNSIKEEAIDIMTYNPARVVNVHFKKRGILLPYEVEITNMFGKKKKVESYESDYKSVMDRYSTVSSKFIATTKFFPEFTNFGTRYKISGGAKSRLYDLQTSSNKQAQYVANHIDELLGLSNKDTNAMTNFLSTTSTLSAATGLSSPTSGVKNLLITIPRMLGTFGIINTSRSFLNLYNNYGQIMTEARRKGFTTYQTKTLALQDKAIDLPFNLGKFSMESLFNFNLMTQTEGIGRVAQVQAGLMTFEQQLAKSHGVKNILNKGGRNQIRDFWKNVYKLSDEEIEFLFDKDNYRRMQDGLADKDMTGKMDYIRAKISHYSHVSTSGGTGPQLLPAWMNNKYVKPMSLFYRMAYSTTFDMAQNHIRPIFKHKNIAPLARATLGSGLSGWALWAMYDALFDVKNPTENEDALTQVASFLWRAEFLQLGSDLLNPYGANMYSKKSAFEFLDFEDQMLASSFNPVYGTAVFRNLSSAGSLFAHTFIPALGLTEQRKTVGQSLDDFMSNTVVLYSQYRKNYQEPFGAGWKIDKLYKTKNEFSTYARRWKSENGYTQKYIYGQSEKTPYYRSLRNAFYNGNQNDFNRAYWAAYNYMVTDMIKGYRRNGKGVNLKVIKKEAYSNLNRHLSSYSVASLSDVFDKDAGIIPEKEFKKYLKDRKLLSRYEKAKKEFEYRKRILVNKAREQQNALRYSVFYDN